MLAFLYKVLAEFDAIGDVDECNFLIAHLNCRSILNTFEELKFYITSQNIDILGLSKTWLNEKIDNNVIRIPGYILIRKDRNNKRGVVLRFT